MKPRVYLAGPDVFLPEPERRAAAMCAICHRHGLHGISPLDPLDAEPPEWADMPEAYRIARRNEAHIRAADAIIANLTPFRGPGADAGTVYEVGFGRGLGRPVFGWAATILPHAERVRRLPGSTAHHDGDGLSIEDFGLFENLMVSCAIIESGGAMVALDGGTPPWPDLRAFTVAVGNAARSLLPGRTRTDATA